MNEIETKTGFYEKVKQELRLRNYSYKTVKSYTSCLRSLLNIFILNTKEIFQTTRLKNI